MEAKELLQAKALGCLDPEDDAVFNKLMEEDENFPWQELGHYQNLVAFLPTLLNIEVPEPEVKDNVARKLYELGEKTKAEEKLEEVNDNKIDETVDQPIESEEKLSEIIEEDGVVIEENPVVENVAPEQALQEDPFNTNTNKEISFKEHGVLQMSLDEPEDIAIKPEEKKTENAETKTSQKPLRKETEQRNVKSYVSKIPTDSHTPEKSSKKSVLIITIILFVVTLLALAFVYLTLTSEIQDNKNEIDKISAEKIIIATGARPKLIPSIPVDHKHIITSSEAMTLKEIPKEMIVIKSISTIESVSE
jgi:hypothetical protein